MAVGLIPVMAAIGAAIDLTRIYLVESQMQSGVDTAALAGARTFGDKRERELQVDGYFLENFPSGFMGSSEDIRPVRSFTTSNGINITQVSASTDLPMTFMKVFGFNTQTISVSARAELQPRPLEVMVVLDNTGSMQTKDVGGGSRMDALKRAMYTFIDVLHQGQSSRNELAMGFVTYNVTTNVGAILTEAGVGVEPIDGFTNIADYTGGANGAANPLGWQGCVADDATVQDLSADPAVSEEGAWDVISSLPGEMRNGKIHPKIRPYLHPPNSKPKSGGKNYYYDTGARSPNSFYPNEDQSNSSDGRKNNHYLLSPSGNMAVGQTLANSEAYRKFFYDFYIGLNSENSDRGSEDVIVRPDGSYYDPATAGAWGSSWIVQYDRIPYINDLQVWAHPNAKYGYPLGTRGASGYALKMAQPNWQCPEPSLKLEYGRAKSVYTNYIRDKNFPIMPANGTLHHIGLLWGYRLLQRSDVFHRANPREDQKPLRALVFMTDGETSVSNYAEWFGAYGRIADHLITRTTSKDEFKKHVLRRFAKVCANAKQDDINVYIVALNASEPEFRTCAGSRYLLTKDADTIDAAFETIAVDLVDLHLTQ